MGEEQKEDRPFTSRLGPIVVDWPRTAGFYGGIAAAIAFELIAPEIALFAAAIPLLKLLKRKHATIPERLVAAVLEGAAKPVGGDADATIKPRWLEEEEEQHDKLENVALQNAKRTMNGAQAQ